jgi:hypothetical protein
MNPLTQALNILTLAAGLEPGVLAFITGLMSSSQGKTPEQFFADADTVWDQIAAMAIKEGATPPK